MVVDLANCEECSLEGAKVFGSGNSKCPSIAFVGEAPGYNEVKQRTPFVGLAGQVIRRIVQAVGICSQDVYFTNLCLCRPPENRDPSAKEIQCCWPRLEAELIEVCPTTVVALGAIPSRVLFQGYTLGNHRGRLLTSCLDIPGTITYHPAATLYPKGSSLFPFILKDIEKIWRFITKTAVDESLSDPSTVTVVIDSRRKMEQLLERLDSLPEQTIISFDWETTGTKPSRDVGFCLGISWMAGTGVVIPDTYVRLYATALTNVLQNHQLTGYNAAMFDVKFNAKLGLPSEVDHDSMLMHYALDERPQHRSLENVTVTELDAPAYESEMLARYGCNKDEMLTKIPSEVVYEYCGKDADWSLRLHQVLVERLREVPKLYSMYKYLLIPAAKVFSEIQEYGVWVDREKLTEISDYYKSTSEQLEADLQQETGIETFNPRSSKQVQEYLWDSLGLEEPTIYGRTPRSADSSTLKVLLEEYTDISFLPKLKDYRENYTLYSRYLRGMNQYIDPDCRVRVQYHLDRTETGRLSTTNPAIHQTPRESKIRNIYSAPPGFALIQADYSQVEMRMAAHCADDKDLATLFQELEAGGADFHSFMASKSFRVALDKVTKDQRQAAKTVSFGILYRMSVKGLSARLGLPIADARKIIQDYEALMPGVMRWIAHIEYQVRKKGYVETIFGRRRRFPFITNDNISELLREGVNTPIQSASSDLTLSKVIELHQTFKTYYPEARIVIMIHDEIVVECPLPLVPKVAAIMKNVMEKPPFETDVPFPVDVVVGQHWGEGETFTPDK